MLFLEHETASGGTENGIQSKPSLFELLMQEKMANGFHPAAAYVLQILCDNNPRLSQSFLAARFDEVFAVLKYVVERHFLTRYDSLASEYFYGIKRVMHHTQKPQSEESSPAMSPLTAKARNQSLIYVVLVPYLKSKLDALYKSSLNHSPSHHSSSPSSSQSNDSSDTSLITSAKISQKLHLFFKHMRQLRFLSRLKRVFLQLYPFVHLSYEATLFLYQFMYLFDDTTYFSPFLRQMKVALVRLTPTDMSNFQQQQAATRQKILSSISGSSLLNRTRRLLLKTSWATLDNSHVLLLLGIGCFKFLEWFYSEEGEAKLFRSTKDLPIPPPPLPPQFSGNAIGLTLDPRRCPLCRRERSNPAMTTSGYVFCYPCIYHYVSDHGECPVTGMRCDLSGVSKIYDEAL